MTRWPETIAFWVSRLPHWEVAGGKYFITLSLSGAIPIEGRVRLRTKSKELHKLCDRHSPDWLRQQRAIFAEMERWLDRAEYEAHLAQREIAEMIIESIEYRRRRLNWEMHEYVVMPTHLHLFAEMGSGGLKGTMEDFKRWTGHRAEKLLGRKGERFWQRDWFDHWSRSDAEDERIVRYIRNNPVKAGLVANFEDWPYRRTSRLPGGT